ncbi:MAG: PIG-L family deacetylase [Candidatus Omnitrophica bacterium]|nr:PIG-L family deacetylase [Candidatus Omnitrophota bacterium]
MKKTDSLSARPAFRKTEPPDWRQIASGIINGPISSVKPLNPKEAAQHVNLASPLPTNSNIVVIAFDEPDLDDIQGLLLRLSQRGNQLFFPRGTSIPEEINRYQPVMVILPSEKSPQWENRDRKRLLREIKTALSQKIRGGWVVYYEPPSLVSVTDWAHFLTPEEIQRKMTAIAAHQSQVLRTDYGAAAKGGMLARGVRLRLGRHLGKVHPTYAETFSIARVVRGAVKQGIGDWNLETAGNGTVCFVSPHYDDLEIAAGGTVTSLIGRGFKVRVLYTSKSTGARMVDTNGKELNDEEKIRRREQETEEGAKVLGITNRQLTFLRFGFRKQEIVENGVTREVREVLEKDRVQFYQALRQTLKDDWEKKKTDLPLIVFLPDPTDNHPTHLATLDIGMDAILKLSTEVQTTILVVYYKSPWAGEANTYLYLTPEQMDTKEKILKSPARIMAAVGNGIVCATAAPELADPGGFGQNTIDPQQLGGPIAERFDLWQVSSGGELLRVDKTRVILGDRDVESKLKDDLATSL